MRPRSVRAASHSGLPRRAAEHGRWPCLSSRHLRRRSVGLHRHGPGLWRLQVIHSLPLCLVAQKVCLSSRLGRCSVDLRCGAYRWVTLFFSHSFSPFLPYACCSAQWTSTKKKLPTKFSTWIISTRVIGFFRLPCFDCALKSPCTSIRITMRPWSAGAVSVRVLVFARAVRDSPLRAEVLPTAPPLLVWGSRGTGKEQLSQPVAVARWDLTTKVFEAVYRN